MALERGTRLGPYSIESPIGGGGHSGEEETTMTSSRREFLRLVAAGSAYAAVGVPIPARTASPPTDWSAVRDAFPWIENHLWISASDYHPLGAHSLQAVRNYYARLVQGPDHGARFTGEQRQETREMFATLINAKPSEIAFIANTTDGENLVTAGMDLGRRRGNVVLDDLHYQASKFLYHMLEKQGDIELRVVRHRADPYWRMDPKDMEQAIDRDTILVSTALVSNINGFLHDAKATSEIAHAHGAYVYADIIQGAGAVPIDVQALGIDFAACGTYKWLQGDRGFGFLFVREDLQDTVVKRSRYGTRQFINPNSAQADSKFELRPGAEMFESSSTLAEAAGVVAHSALKYIHSLGVPNIAAHNASLVERLQEELPALGYPPITPPGNPTSVVSFLTPDPEQTRAKLDKAFGYMVIARKRWEFTYPSGDTHVIQGIRVGPSVYNNEEDIDRLLEALS